LSFKPSKDRYKPYIEYSDPRPAFVVSNPQRIATNALSSKKSGIRAGCFKPSKDRYKQSRPDENTWIAKSFKPSKDRYKQNRNFHDRIGHAMFQTLKGSLQTYRSMSF